MVSRLLSENMAVMSGIPNPCINKAMQPVYDSINPVCSTGSPKCLVEISIKLGGITIIREGPTFGNIGLYTLM